MVRINLNCFRLIRKYISIEAAHVFIHAMILSHISYCITVWTQTSDSLIKKIEMLYNRALKIMDKKPNRWHHCNVKKNFYMLSFTNFKNLSYIKLIFKCLHNKAPLVLCKLIKRQDDTSRITRSSAGGNCRINFRRTTQGQRAFSVEGSKLWNLLPNEFKAILELKSFTLKVKRWFKINQNCTHI